MVTELVWLKKRVNNVLIGSDWLNMLVDWDENVRLIKLTKYDFAAAYLYTTTVVFVDGMQT